MKRFLRVPLNFPVCSMADLFHLSNQTIRSLGMVYDGQMVIHGDLWAEEAPPCKVLHVIYEL